MAQIVPGVKTCSETVVTKDALYSVEFPLSGASHWSLFHENKKKSHHHNAANAAGEKQRTAGTGCQGFYGALCHSQSHLLGISVWLVTYHQLCLYWDSGAVPEI